jgi:hypothetical protein
MKEHRNTVPEELLSWYHLEGDNFLKNNATGDKSWVHHYDSENKRQSRQYRHPGSPSVKKFKTVPKVIFWNARDMLCTEFLTKEFMVNSNRYCATL